MTKPSGVAEHCGGAASLDEVERLLARLNVSPAANLINVLQQVQEEYGYLSAETLQAISRRMKTPLSRIYGVVSFYTQFYTQPHGKHTIRCCRGTACHVKGSQRVINMVQQVLGIEEGQTTPDMIFYLETVACLGTCFLAPAMMIDSQYYGRLSPQRVAGILKSFQAKRS